jgi:hypothetical protein
MSKQNRALSATIQHFTSSCHGKKTNAFSDTNTGALNLPSRLLIASSDTPITDPRVARNSSGLDDGVEFICKILMESSSDVNRLDGLGVESSWSVQAMVNRLGAD